MEQRTLLAELPRWCYVERSDGRPIAVIYGLPDQVEAAIRTAGRTHIRREDGAPLPDTGAVWHTVFTVY